MVKLIVETILVIWLVMWLFNLLTFIKQPAKDIVNCVVIILLIIFKFFVGWCDVSPHQ